MNCYLKVLSIKYVVVRIQFILFECGNTISTDGSYSELKNDQISILCCIFSQLNCNSRHIIVKKFLSVDGSMVPYPQKISFISWQRRIQTIEFESRFLVVVKIHSFFSIHQNSMLKMSREKKNTTCEAIFVWKIQPFFNVKSMSYLWREKKRLTGVFLLFGLHTYSTHAACTRTAYVQ